MPVSSDVPSARDVLAAKLLVRREMLPREAVAAGLDALAAGKGEDLLTLLTVRGQITAETFAWLRQRLAIHERVFCEAIYLWGLEELLPAEQVASVIARAEQVEYRRRVGTLLQEEGAISADDDAHLTAEVRELRRARDRSLLARYRRETAEDPREGLRDTREVGPASFRLGAVYRSRGARKWVARLRAELIRKAAETRIEPQRPPVPSPRPLANPLRAEGEDAGWRAPPRDPKTGARDTGAITVALLRRQWIDAFEVVECLGAGGMGAVYLANEEGGGLVAVKVLLDTATPVERARFEREARILERLDHRALPTLLERERTEDGLDYFATPYYAGKDLRHVLDEQGPLPLADVLELARQLLAALGAAHAAGVVHRDLKPANVILLAGTELRVRLIDFGIARRLDDELPPGERLYRSDPGVISGSPRYIAPETISGDPCDPRTDLYSLGVLLFEALTGRLPLYGGDDNADYLREHLMGVPLTLEQGQRDGRWSPGLQVLFDRLLAKRPAERPESCAAVAAELDPLEAEALAFADAGPADAPRRGLLRRLLGG